MSTEIRRRRALQIATLMNVLTDIKNRGVADVFFIVCDGLKGQQLGAVHPVPGLRHRDPAAVLYG